MSEISKDQQGLKIDAYLWSCPDQPHWKRLLCGIIYIPLLIWHFLKGTPVLIGKWEMYQKGENYIYYRGKPHTDNSKDMVLIISEFLCFFNMMFGILTFFMVITSELQVTDGALALIFLIPVSLWGSFSIPPIRSDGIKRLIYTFAWGISCSWGIFIILIIIDAYIGALPAHSISHEVPIIFGLIAGAVRYFGETYERRGSF